MVPPRFVPRSEMEDQVPGAWSALPPQVRDRVPAGIVASSVSMRVFRRGFGEYQNFVNRLYTRLHYRDGESLPLWKLLMAYYLVEAEVGANTMRRVASETYAVVEWPSEVRVVTDVLKQLDRVYRASLGDPRPTVVPGWRVEELSSTRAVMVNATLSPCSYGEGFLEGICRAFAWQKAKSAFVPGRPRKRDGGTETWFEVTFEPAGVASVGRGTGRT